MLTRRFEVGASMILAMMVLWPFAGAQLGLQNNTCLLAGFVPFTYAGVVGTETEDYGLDRLTSNMGFSHMAAAVLAMDQFNNRDPTVVSELSSLGDCNIVFDMNNSYFFDTGMITHRSTQLLQEEIIGTGIIPCAIAGPYNDLPAQLLSTFAASVEIPLVAHRAYNLRVNVDFFSPYSNQVYPDQLAMIDALLAFLRYTERTNYIAILYSAVGDTATQRRESLALRLKAEGMQYRPYTFEYEYSQAFEYEYSQGDEVDEALTLKTALTNLKNDGYRTVVVMLDFPQWELQLIADTAEEVGGVNGDDYFWIYAGGIDLSAFSWTPVGLNDNSISFLAGSAMLSPLEGFQAADPDNDPFAISWKSQNASFVDRVNAYVTIGNDEPGHYTASPDYFQRLLPEPGAGFMFDAVMSIGIGACVANTSSHLEGIRSVDFTGATGRVRLGNGMWAPGGRNSSDAVFGVVNLFHEFAARNQNEWDSLFGKDGEPTVPLYQVSATFESHGGPLADAEWTELAPFIYRSGSDKPPELLRATPDQNYLDPLTRAFGITLMSVALISCTCAFVWVYRSRKHPILQRAQPMALQMICFGSFMISWSIFPLSFDESYGWSEQQLSRGCMSVPWLVSVGHIIVFGAIFAKLWRLNRVLQFRRVKVDMLHVAWPAALLATAAIVLLTIMTVKSPLYWDRTEIDESTGESIANCNSDWFGAFIWTLAFIMLIPTVLTGIMAWKTQDVDTSYSDSFWVAVLIIIQIEVVLLSVPVVTILREVSTGGRYFGIVAILWTFPTSTMCLIILPKVICYWRAIRGHSSERTTRRAGGRGEVHVTGMQNNEARIAQAEVIMETGREEAGPS